MSHHTWIIFVFLVEMGFHCVGLADLELPTSGDPPASASQSGRITGMSHHGGLRLGLKKKKMSCITMGKSPKLIMNLSSGDNAATLWVL